MTDDEKVDLLWEYLDMLGSTTYDPYECRPMLAELVDAGAIDVNVDYIKAQIDAAYDLMGDQ